MQIIKDCKLPGGFANGIVLTLGNFDGVHRGHKAIIEETKKIARVENLPFVLMTFAPHPVAVLKPEIAPFCITTFAQKAELIGKLAPDLLLVMKFDSALAMLLPEDFVKKIMVENLKTRHVVIGHDFNFGRARAGNAEYLQKKAAEYGFGFTQLAPQKLNEPFSSTLIRNHIRKGEMKEAEILLGHQFAIEGVVLHGDEKGREIGFPTANLVLGDYVRPKFGVYAVKTQIEKDGPWHKSIANIGIRPTIGGDKELLEAHILDWSENIYGQTIRVALQEFIREEMRFANLDELKKQIALDMEKLPK